MTADFPYLLVRAGALYVTLLLTAVVWVWRRPRARALAGAWLATIWNVPVLLLLHVVATDAGWWIVDARGGLLLGLPVEFLLSWAWLWGGVAALAFPAAPLPLVVAGAVGFDLALMPLAEPVLQLKPGWLVAEAVGVVAGLVPGLLLARWTMRGERLAARATLQAIAFGGLIAFVIPAIAIEGAGGGWLNPLDRPTWQVSLIVQILGVPAVIGLSALQEFVTRGGGTPVPFDPPRRLVTTGVYAYVRNPMQLSAVVLLALIGVVAGNLWISAAGVMAHVYSVGLAAWDEESDLRERFGDEWLVYRRNVRRWIPRWRPWHPPGTPLPQLFVGHSCGVCRGVADWLAARDVLHIRMVAAEAHPSRALTRIAYEPGDGTRPASGVEAIARALEHIHLGWAVLGFAVRLPVVRTLAQILVDASGGGPRRLHGLPPEGGSHLWLPALAGRNDEAETGPAMCQTGVRRGAGAAAATGRAGRRG